MQVLDECIIRVEGVINFGDPVMLSFTSLTSAGKTTTYGPYGSVGSGGGETPFSIEGVILAMDSLEQIK